jgi:hypothetical protein
MSSVREFALLTLGLMPTVSAQSVSCPVPEMVGAVATWSVHAQTMSVPCPTATEHCQDRQFLPVNSDRPYSGAIAFDPMFEGYWLSNGVQLALIRLGPACTGRCWSVAIQTLPPCRSDLSAALAAEIRVSGLAVDDHRRRLFVLRTAPHYYWIETYDIRTICSAVFLACCEAKFNPGSTTDVVTAGGLAYDGIHDLLFVALSTSNASGAFDHMLHVVRASNPCVVLCRRRFDRPFCWPAGKILTGVALDACEGRLFVTEGSMTRTVQILDAAACRFTELPTCCPKVLPVDYRGLTVHEAWSVAPCGAGCVVGPCPVCPELRPVFTGTSLELLGVPANALALCAVGPQCDPPLALPFACAPLYVVPVILLRGGTAAGPSCGGAVQIAVPRPPRGVTFALQWAVACSGGALPLSMSRGLSVRIL